MEEERVLVAVDAGKYATKAITIDKEDRTERVFIRTKMNKTEETKSMNNKTYAVQYKGEKYLLGKGAENEDFDVSKTKLIHKLSAYLAVAHAIKFQNNLTVDIIIGCPLSIFSKVKAREEFVDYIKSDGKVELLVNQIPITFNIGSVIAAPESSGVLMKKQKEYKDRLVGVIDIGGLNTNCCVYDGLTPISKTIFTNNLGANILRVKLRDYLNDNLADVNIQDYQMEMIIKDGFVKSDKEKSERLIKLFFNKHISDILEEAKKKSWDINSMDLLFIGGGSLLLENQIKAFVEDAIVSETAQWDNVEGFYVMGKVLLG